jgi:dTDP-4-amino-4,6-dideoxygalactose transaminase
MKFVDLNAQQELIRDELERQIRNVLAHGNYIMGPEVGALENRLAEFVGVKYAVGCSSGTDALLLSLMASGVGPGDAIFTTPFTFIATAEVIVLLGATPVFVDIDPKTFNMDPTKLERAIDALKSRNASEHVLPADALLPSLTPKGIITVDLFGLPADYDLINSIASKQGLFVLEDGAQSFGGEYRGRKACSLGDISCTSFFPAKPLGCYGDGGMCFTDDESLAHSLQSLRVHGKGDHKYDNVCVGMNGRLDTLQAAILLAKFDIFPGEVELRQEVAHRYGELISENGNGNPGFVTPEIPAGYKSAWAQYSILTEDKAHRKNTQDKLKEAGIPSAIYYPLPLHLQSAFASLGYRQGDFPVSEDCSKRILSLPIHPYLEKTDQERIILTIS